EALLTTLYHKAHAILHHGKGQNKQLHIDEIQRKARLLMKTSEGITALWSELGDDYFLSSTPQDVARETEAILKQDFPIVLEREGDKGSTRFILITQNCDYLFAATTYFLEQQNLSIVDAYIISTESQYIISGYTILEDKIRSVMRVKDILEGLKQALLSDNKTRFLPIRRYIPKQLKQFPLPTRVTFTQDHIHNHTIMELVTSDRPGLLSRIAETFVTCQVRLKKAKIATFSCHVEDIFFITNYSNHALYSADQLDSLRDKLSELLDEDMPK
ncbi:MAG: [protein-PII] uridylyltransferase, partial [Thiotrichaceae bacterium]|nr:[protein-PII] uridylyltransferase [Thiotrichaceae bacterium]